MAVARVLSLLVFVLFAFCIDVIRAGEYCYYYGYSYTYYKYCTYGCCGSNSNRYCCSLSVGVIVGGVIAGIIFISVVIAIICCLVKKKSHPGRVVQPAPGTQPPRGNVMVIHTGANTSQPYYGAQPMAAGAQPVPPPAYKQAGAPPPPAYTYSDPAYPPTGPTYPPPSGPAYPPPPGPAYPPPPAAGPSSPFNVNASQASSSGTAQVQPPPPGFQAGGPAPAGAATAPPAWPDKG